MMTSTNGPRGEIASTVSIGAHLNPFSVTCHVKVELTDADPVAVRAWTRAADDTDSDEGPVGWTVNRAPAEVR